MGNRRRIHSNDIRLGMHVVELDRPWLETPFLFQGFTVRNLEEITQLRRLCDYVLIDDTAPAEHPKRAAPNARSSPSEPALTKSTASRRIVGARDYGPELNLEAELEPAKLAYRSALQRVHRLFDDSRSGRLFDSTAARQSVHAVVKSVIRNPSALLWFAQLQKREGYIALHSVNVTVYAVALGRHLGFPEDALTELGLAALLHDVGKLQVPSELLNKAGRLTPEETERVRHHALLGAQALETLIDLPQSVVTVALRHHEALDGSGYPGGSKGDEIDYFSRLVGIVDRYDALTSDRCYRDAVSPQEALKILYKLRDRVLDAELVSQFIRCMGVYPVGTLVELSSGEVGMVIGNNLQRRLRPKVLITLNDSKRPQLPERIVDLAHARQETLAVTRALNPHSYGIDPNWHIQRYRSGGLPL
jgi:putative nucleotidyltransferase with HDIG domain